MVKALREAVLLSAAHTQGVTKLARGDSASRLAARAIAMSAKGQGFSLPASMHYLDARYTLSQAAVCGVQPSSRWLYRTWEARSERFYRHGLRRQLWTLTFCATLGRASHCA